MRLQTLTLGLELLDAGRLDLGALRSGAKITIVALPALMPGRELRVRRAQRRGGRRLAVRAFRSQRLQSSQLRAQGLELLLVAHDLPGERAEAGVDLGQIAARALAPFPTVADALLRASHLGAQLVIATLNGCERLTQLVVRRALALDPSLGGALIGERLLHGELTAAHCSVLHLRAAVELAQLQRQQFSAQRALLRLAILVAARDSGLALQMPDLTVHLVAQILQPREVLTRLGHARLGLATSLLVERYARSLLDKGTHVVVACLDHARDHVLLDDGVAARAQARAQEQVRDVLAPATPAVDEIGRAAIARDRPFQRYLAVTGVGAADLAVAIIEHQLNGGGTDGFARRGAIENHVRHGVPAQVAGRELAHDPAHGVDDVGLAATIGSHDAGQVARQLH